MLKDLDGDGKPEFVYGAEGSDALRQARSRQSDRRLDRRTVSEPGLPTSIHGVGAGDINGDGKVDILNAPHGWWEQPAKAHRRRPGRITTGVRTQRQRGGGNRSRSTTSTATSCNDVVTALAAHGFGLAWYEQKRDAAGEISFVEHMIMDDFAARRTPATSPSRSRTRSTLPTSMATASGHHHRQAPLVAPGQLHRSRCAWRSGLVLVYGRCGIRRRLAARSSCRADSQPVGRRLDDHAADLNKDGRMDVVTPTKFGTFIFWGQGRR